MYNNIYYYNVTRLNEFKRKRNVFYKHSGSCKQKIYLLGIRHYLGLVNGSDEMPNIERITHKMFHFKSSFFQTYGAVLKAATKCFCMCEQTYPLH